MPHGSLPAVMSGDMVQAASQQMPMDNHLMEPAVMPTVASLPNSARNSFDARGPFDGVGVGKQEGGGMPAFSFRPPAADAVGGETPTKPASGHAAGDPNEQGLVQVKNDEQGDGGVGPGGLNQEAMHW